MAITIPNEYGYGFLSPVPPIGFIPRETSPTDTSHTKHSYVLLAASSTIFVNMLHMSLTSRRRKAAGIKYPITYASAEQADKDPKAYAFNCGMLLSVIHSLTHSLAL